MNIRFCKLNQIHILLVNSQESWPSPLFTCCCTYVHQTSCQPHFFLGFFHHYAFFVYTTFYTTFKTTFKTTGWWFQPLWKIWKSVGMMKSPIYGKIKLMFQTTNQFLMCLVLSTYFNHLNSPSRISLWNPKWSDSAGWTCQWPVPAFRPRWRSPGGRGGHFMRKNIEASLQDASLQWWLLVYNPHEKYSYLSYL